MKSNKLKLSVSEIKGHALLDIVILFRSKFSTFLIAFIILFCFEESNESTGVPTCLHVLEQSYLVIEEELPGVIALEEEVQVVQHGRVVEHEVHDLMTQQSAELYKNKTFFYSMLYVSAMQNCIVDRDHGGRQN